ncbi:hypothetical protein ABNF97_07795 [Plantactinospora sp. B6F1]|uniref:hypothetical protein n=1 Tax=Plantactinospora sp. B6F1 TaxID=3158971 RepID=UPI0032D90184
MAERKKLLLRLDPQVYEAIARWAADDIRSVNAQIEYALRLALRSAGRTVRPARRGVPAGLDGSGSDGAGSDPAGPGPTGSYSSGPDGEPLAGADPDGAGPDDPAPA